MSAPQTNIERQVRWHRWPLIGIAAVLVFSTIMGILIVWDGTNNAENPRTPPAVVDGRTGESQPTTPEPAANPPAEAVNPPAPAN